MNKTNQVTLQTRSLPLEWTPADSKEVAQAVLLCYQDGRFIFQTIFAQPLTRQINWIEGLKDDGDVYIREINAIGLNLFHVRLVGKEDDVWTMCGEPGFFNVLRGIDNTLTEDTRSRSYLDLTSCSAHWDAIVDVQGKAFCLANDVNARQIRTRIGSIIVVGDRLLGLTDQRKVVIGKLTHHVIEGENRLLDVEAMESVTKLGKIDLLARVPNSDSVFLVIVQNRVYQCDLWGTMTSFEELPESVKQINSVEFNHARSVLATSEGLFEIDIQEMPNMMRATGLPRQIVNTQLPDGFRVARYIEDPFVLVEHPAMAIIAKTTDEKVCAC